MVGDEGPFPGVNGVAGKGECKESACSRHGCRGGYLGATDRLSFADQHKNRVLALLGNAKREILYQATDLIGVLEGASSIQSIRRMTKK